MTGRICSLYNSPTRHGENNITEVRTGAGSRGWKTSATGKGSLSKHKNIQRDKNRLVIENRRNKFFHT